MLQSNCTNLGLMQILYSLNQILSKTEKIYILFSCIPNIIIVLKQGKLYMTFQITEVF